MTRRSVKPVYSMCVQPAFIIGTNNKDGSHNFAPITWVSVTHEEGDEYLLVISMSGTKQTKQNILRTGIFSANLVSKDMLPLMDYLGSRHGRDGRKDEMYYKVSRGMFLNVPTLDDSPWVYECEVARAVETGDSTTFFCYIRNVQMDERLSCEDTFDVDLTVLDPIIYSGRYHSVGEMLGRIGDFLPDADIISEEAKEQNDVLEKFHRSRTIMIAIFVISTVIGMMGAVIAMYTPVIMLIGLLGLVAAVVYGLVSGAMYCPYCGQDVGRQAGKYCKHCGKEIF